MTLLLSLAALLPRLLLGFCIVHFLWSAADGKSFLVKVFLSAGIGFGLSSLFSFLWIWAGLPLAIYAILESLIAIALAVIVFFYNRPLFTFIHTSDKTNTIWALLLAFGFFLFVVNFLLLARQHPHGLSDAWINWNVVARFISLGGADFLLEERQHAKDAVFIPAEDGGYVLVGLRCPQPQLFAAIEWGSERVMAQTRQRLSGSGLRWGELPRLWDVDRPADLLRLANLEGFVEWSQ